MVMGVRRRRGYGDGGRVVMVMMVQVLMLLLLLLQGKCSISRGKCMDKSVDPDKQIQSIGT